MSHTEQLETAETIAKHFETLSGNEFHQCMEQLPAKTLRLLLQIPGGGRYLAVNWADEYLPKAVLRELDKTEAEAAAEAAWARTGKGPKGNLLWTVLLQGAPTSCTFRAKSHSDALAIARFRFWGQSITVVRGDKRNRSRNY